MDPELPAGCRVTVARRRFGLVLPGDAVAYSTGEQWLVHRLLGPVWWQGRWMLVTQADVSVHHDAPVARDRVIGRVTHRDGEDLRVSPTRRVRSMFRLSVAVARSLGSHLL